MLRQISPTVTLIALTTGVLLFALLLSVGEPFPATATSLRFSEFVVTNTNDGGPGSFRAAVDAANSTPGFDVIKFNIDSGVKRIPIGAAGPITISDPVEIDGTSQPGTGPAPRIEFTKNYPGNGAGGGIRLATNNCRIHGLRFVNFVSNAAHIYAIDIPGNNNHIYGNVFGSETGPGEPNDAAINISGINNVIGGDSESERNIIRKNYRGIELVAPGPNFIKGNSIIEHDLVGRDPATIRVGIFTANDSGAENNRGVEIKNNVVSGGGPSGIGIMLNGVDSAIVENNKIGVDATGMIPMPQFQGVQIDGGSGTKILSNVISGNSANLAAGGGIISLSTGVVIQNNLIGLASDGLTWIPNTGGILLGFRGGTIGGDNSLGIVRNYISGNLKQQISLDIRAEGTGVIQGNTIGLNRAGGGNGNGKTGTGTGIGGTTSSGTVKIGGTSASVRNVISGNAGDGINLRRTETRFPPKSEAV